MTWHHPALAKDALAESDVEIKTLRAENERLRAYQNETAKAWTKLTESQEQEIDRLRVAVADERNKVAAAVTELLAICDGSNWPAEAQSGVGYRLYTDLTDRLHEIADDLRPAITAEQVRASAVMTPEPYEEIAALRELVREQDEEMERLKQVVIHLQKERRELRSAITTGKDV